MQDETHTRLAVTAEAQTYLDAGASPEKAVFDGVPAEGADMKSLQASLSAVWGVGFKKAMEKKWVAVSKVDGVSLVKRVADSADDSTLAQLQAIVAGQEVPPAQVAVQAVTLRCRALLMGIHCQVLQL